MTSSASFWWRDGHPFHLPFAEQGGGTHRADRHDERIDHLDPIARASPSLLPARFGIVAQPPRCRISGRTTSARAGHFIALFFERFPNSNELIRTRPKPPVSAFVPIAGQVDMAGGLDGGNRVLVGKLD
jgi:hypothetical protein